MTDRPDRIARRLAELADEHCMGTDDGNVQDAANAMLDAGLREAVVLHVRFIEVFDAWMATKDDDELLHLISVSLPAMRNDAKAVLAKLDPEGETPPTVEDTIEFAKKHYDNALRRLAEGAGDTTNTVETDIKLDPEGEVEDGKAVVGEEQKCKHLKCVPAWDEEACKGKSSDWIRQHYPRFDGVCPDCLQKIIYYASDAQYILGDY